MKGVIEETPDSAAGSAMVASGNASSPVQEAFLAEAAKILKGLSLRTCRVSEPTGEVESPMELGLDLGWLVSAVASASDHSMALVDSGSTNALRPAQEGELSTARIIRVDLASGAAELHISKHGTLLSAHPCQVIIPAGYLVQLGYTISWKSKGCVIQRPGGGHLEVKVVKGCPLISREVGLGLLDEYETLREKGELATRNREVVKEPPDLPKDQARFWLASRVSGGRLSR